MAQRRIIDKIKYKRAEKTLFLNYRQLNDVGNWDKLTLETNDPPDPDFIAAMGSLGSHVVDICEVGDEWADKEIKVSGVSLSHTGGIMGAVITAQIKLLGSQSPLNINTPSKPAEPYNEGGTDEYCLHPDAVKAIEFLVTEAEGYLNGKRAQQQIDFDKDMKEPFEAEMKAQGIDVALTMQDDPADRSYTPDGSGYSSPRESDPLFDDAKALVMQHHRTTTSHIQRLLKVGYARAGRIMVELEAAGIVSKSDNVGNREVLAQDE